MVGHRELWGGGRRELSGTSGQSCSARHRSALLHQQRRHGLSVVTTLGGFNSNSRSGSAGLLLLLLHNQRVIQPRALRLSATPK